MIASIRGEVLAAGSGWVVVAVGGIGLRIEVASARLPSAYPGAEVLLHTSLIVREDSLTLFGFATQQELEVFGHLIAVSGVGPKSALGVLAALTPHQVARAVADENEKPFRSVSGIGPKTAKLLMVSLAGKVLPEAFAATEGETVLPEDTMVDQASQTTETVRLGLVGLGYSEAQADLAVGDALSAGVAVEGQALLRAALALLQAPRAGVR